jgi:hypothetical protein
MQYRPLWPENKYADHKKHSALQMGKKTTPEDPVNLHAMDRFAHRAHGQAARFV